MPTSNLELEPPETVLVVKPSSFGDIIHTLPAVARLKAAWPTARITWLVNSEWSPLLEDNPDLEGIVPFPRRQFRGLTGWWKFIRWQHENVRWRRPNLVLDFQGLFRSALIGRLSGPRALYGMANAREGARWFYDRTASLPPGVPHAVERYLALADHALQWHGPSGMPSTPPLRFPLPPGKPLSAEDTVKLQDGFVLLHPFARGVGKSLTTQQVEEFRVRLAPRQVVIVGRRPDAMVHAPSISLDLLDRTTLPQLLWLMRQASFVISVDSGPAHLAAALGCPLVAIHTWSDPRRVGPYRNDAWVWKSGRLVQVRDLCTLPAAFFRTPSEKLSTLHIDAICALAISPSGSCA